MNKGQELASAFGVEAESKANEADAFVVEYIQKNPDAFTEAKQKVIDLLLTPEVKNELKTYSKEELQSYLTELCQLITTQLNREIIYEEKLGKNDLHPLFIYATSVLRGDKKYQKYQIDSEEFDKYLFLASLTKIYYKKIIDALTPEEIYEHLNSQNI